jgi:LacI family transcriptional regulator
MKSQRMNIKEVARLAGVSTQTISRVLNDRPDVSPETRQRVKQIIQELGYRPSALARSLIQQRSYTLGVVTAGLKYFGPSRTLNGITSKAEELGYALLLKELPGFQTSDIDPILQSLLGRHVDGIVWAVPQIRDNHDWLEQRPPEPGIPMLFLAMPPRSDLSVISIDNYLGAQMATRHLLEKGYQHIGHLSGPQEWWEARQRKVAWQDTLREAGRPVPDQACVEGNWSSASGLLAFETLFEQYPEMDAVFVANDQMALSVMQFACKHNIAIPKALGVVGFDDMPESPFFPSPLTTVCQDQPAMGALAVNELVRMIELKNRGVPVENKQIQTEPTLIVRESSRK